MQIVIPENVKFILNTLYDNGFKAYVVGGCVRDRLLCLPAGDYDICTSAKPSDVIRLFEKTVATGTKHGTVTVIVNKTPVEVTTFRTDGDYSDSRRPDTVEFVDDLKADLSRRDFTVNALCYSENEGLIDYFNGVDDLKAKTLRAVGDADKRFKEDALRILRLFRFSSALGFNIEKHTFDAAMENAHLLKNISAERIEKELKKTACGKNPSAVLPLIATGALPTFKVNENISKVPLLPQKDDLKFFAFLYLLSESLPETLAFLKCSNAFKKYAADLCGNLYAEADDRKDIKHLLAALENNVFDLFYLKTALLGEDTKEKAATAKEIKEKNEPYKTGHLAVSGDDVAKKGYRGAQINKVLARLLEAVINDPELNKRETLERLI